jgi:NADPH:quinone reductase-like Zn-dependent oxidoreductase
MRALQFTTYGGPEVLAWAEAPDAHAGPGQIRIVVRAASVNPIDWKIFSGMVSGGEPLAGPGYLGYDAAGVVDEVGEGVTGVSVGDEVFGRGSNTQAQYAVLDSWVADATVSRRIRRPTGPCRDRLRPGRPVLRPPRGPKPQQRLIRCAHLLNLSTRRRPRR